MALRDSFLAVDPNTPWELTDVLRLDFPTFHPQGLCVTEDRILLSSVEVRQPRRPLPPGSGYDRTPGSGIGHLFVLDHAGTLQHDLTLGDGDRYHPGGIDSDGSHLWVPVAEYRPDSSSTIHRVDLATLDAAPVFEVADHVGGVVVDHEEGRVVGHTWGSRRFVEWDLAGAELDSWPNPSHLIDYQDGQYAGGSTAFFSGVSLLRQHPDGGGGDPAYELGGIALVDLASRTTLHEIPFQQWSSAGHVATRNPFAISADGDRLTVRVAPDDGGDGRSTEILTYEATVPSGCLSRPARGRTR